MSFRSLSFSFRMAHNTIASLVYETCQAIWDEFNTDHMPFPTEEMFLTISEEFFTEWNFPNCIGCIDGKHIRIKCPPNSGSMYFNYKQYYSIVLQAVADANYKFICIDVGSYGKQSDGGIFANSSLFHHLENNSLHVPESKPLPGTDIILPHVLLGDEAYPLKPYLMKPYSRKDLQGAEETFNYRLSRGRRVVECAFGILTSKWRLLLKEIEARPENADIIVKCVCLLHNIIIDKERLSQITRRQMYKNINNHTLHSPKPSRVNNRASTRACEIREGFKNYFCGVGSIAYRTTDC